MRKREDLLNETKHDAVDEINKYVVENVESSGFFPQGFLNNNYYFINLYFSSNLTQVQVFSDSEVYFGESDHEKSFSTDGSTGSEQVKGLDSNSFKLGEVIEC